MNSRLLLIAFLVLSGITVRGQKTIEGTSKSYRFDIVKQEFSLPPILSIDTISFSNAALRAGDVAHLNITMVNTGYGDAKDVQLNLSGGITGLTFPSITRVNTILKEGGRQSVSIPFTTGIDLPNAEVIVKIEVIEPNFKVKIKAKQFTFQVIEFQKPELILAQNAILENQSSNPNRQIDINETIDLKLAIQNVGQGVAENVSIQVLNNQAGVLFLGVGDELRTSTKIQPIFLKIDAGNYKTLTYHYFITSDCPDTELVFNIIATEKNGKFGFTARKSFPINKLLQEEGFIRKIASKQSVITDKPIIEDVPEFVVDVDYDIPKTITTQENTFAVIIANENYDKVDKVSYALNDGRIFQDYCSSTLGIPQGNIHYRINQTFGNMRSEIKWLNAITESFGEKAKIIFYYAGHGIPNPATNTAYLLPTDCSENDFESAIKLDYLYETLAEHPSGGIFVFLDACFSGSTRDGGMLENARKVAIVPKTASPKGKMVIFTASTGDQVANPLHEKQHGLFTYFLLKKMQQSKGEMTLTELSDYVIQNVRQQSTVKYSKSQTPQVVSSNELSDSWKMLKLK